MPCYLVILLLGIYLTGMKAYVQYRELYVGVHPFYLLCLQMANNWKQLKCSSKGDEQKL